MNLRPLAGFAFAGCVVAGHYHYTATSVELESAKAPTCEFAVTATAPGDGFKEIGLLDGYDGDGHPMSAFDFKKQVHDQVCRVGGDVVVTQVNGLGGYVRGVVFRKV